MGKNQSEQSLARRNGIDVMRGGSAGIASHPPTTISDATAATTATIDTTDNDTGRESVRGQPEVADVIVEIPIVTPPSGHISERVDVRLTLSQATTLKAINYGLQARNSRLKNGTVVKNNGHAFLWILEQM
jgi:hypothetical protein